MLALELYNRPSLDNRIDGFTFLFCAAWEQLLKAMLIEKSGENSIYKSRTRPGGIRETLSLRECLELLFDKSSYKRKNIERIAYYRDQAVHLLMPEVQNSISRLFQSGILNFFDTFQYFAQQPVLNTYNGGFLSLVGDMHNPSVIHLTNLYGKTTGKEILQLIDELNHEMESIDNIEYAIPIKVKMVFARENEDGTVFKLSKAEDGIEALRDAIVIEKPVDRSITHPYLTRDVVDLINKRGTERLGYKIYTEHLTGDSINRREKFTDRDLQAILFKLKWKTANNKYHYQNDRPVIHYYSDYLIEDILKLICQDKNYLEGSRRSYQFSLRKSPPSQRNQKVVS